MRCAVLPQMAALQHVASGGMPSHAALLAATAAATWPMPAPGGDPLGLLGGGAGHLAPGLQSMLLQDPVALRAAVQAAAMQHQLAAMQVGGGACGVHL